MGVNSKDYEKAKAQVEELSKQVRELGAKNRELQAQLEDLLGRMRPSQELDAELESKRRERDALIEMIGSLEEASEIVSKRDAMLLAADKQAKDMLSAAKNELESVNRQVAEMDSKLKEITEAIGIYEQADKVLSTADARVKEITAQAQKDSAQTVADAKDTAKGIVAEAEAMLREETERAKERVAEAKEIAENITDRAKSDAQHTYDQMRVEGEAIKHQIVSSAEQAGNEILEKAKFDAGIIEEKIKISANSYDQKTRLAADEYAESVRGKADEYKKKASEDAARIQDEAVAKTERLLDEAMADAAKIVDDARKQREGERNKLVEQQAALVREQEELKAAEQRLEAKKQALANRESRLEEEVDERVNERYREIINERDSAQQTANDVNKINKQLHEKLQDQRLVKLNAEEVDQFIKLKKLLDGTEGMSFDKDIVRLVEYKKLYQQLQRDYEKLLNSYGELSKNNGDLKKNQTETVGLKEQLNMATSQKDYFEGVAKNLLAELEKRKEVTREGMLLHVKEAPKFIKSGKFMPNADEIEWLENIKERAEKNGLYFTDRQLYAYHTAQKIRDISSLVVLAGVSGTGKSELPKNYALYGGMHFLSVPVKPDWDSPAALFGYFNSIEHVFEPTDLLRAIWQMATSRKDQMFMVLLDEMNLAHPEQYFADLLSKLETCRGTDEIATYDITLGAGEKPEPISIGGNVLWTGTMNEDETTKGLSDKVIDRSTLITFPRPKILRSRRSVAEDQTPTEFLQVSTWNGWLAGARYGKENDPVEKYIAEYRKTVEQINNNMSYMSRNLGHRVWQGMEAYIRNYPTVIKAKSEDELKKEMDVAFADAIAFKIMPKLRGVEVKGQNEQYLDEIGNTLKDNAVSLTGDYDNARKMATELFQWNSAEFMNDPDEGKK